jgi:hypothetical protein
MVGRTRVHVYVLEYHNSDHWYGARVGRLVGHVGRRVDTSESPSSLTNHCLPSRRQLEFRDTRDALGSGISRGL